MSEPLRTSEDALLAVLSEIVSAESALNMEPRPIEAPRHGAKYLSERDEWAQHAMEHLRAAFKFGTEAQVERERLKTKIFRLEVEIARLRGQHR